MNENKINLIPVCIPEDKCKAKFDHHGRLIKVCPKCQKKYKEILDKSFVGAWTNFGKAFNELIKQTRKSIINDIKTILIPVLDRFKKRKNKGKKDE